MELTPLQAEIIDEMRALIMALQSVADEIETIPDTDLDVLLIKCRLLRRLHAVLDHVSALVREHMAAVQH